jgi:hypothetical protein
MAGGNCPSRCCRGRSGRSGIRAAGRCPTAMRLRGFGRTDRLLVAREGHRPSPCGGAGPAPAWGRAAAVDRSEELLVEGGELVGDEGVVPDLEVADGAGVVSASPRVGCRGAGASPVTLVPRSAGGPGVGWEPERGVWPREALFGQERVHVAVDEDAVPPVRVVRVDGRGPVQHRGEQELVLGVLGACQQPQPLVLRRGGQLCAGVRGRRLVCPGGRCGRRTVRPRAVPSLCGAAAGSCRWSGRR